MSHIDPFAPADSHQHPLNWSPSAEPPDPQDAAELRLHAVDVSEPPDPQDELLAAKLKALEEAGL